MVAHKGQVGAGYCCCRVTFVFAFTSPNKALLGDVQLVEKQGVVLVDVVCFVKGGQMGDKYHSNDQVGVVAGTGFPQNPHVVDAGLDHQRCGLGGSLISSLPHNEYLAASVPGS